MYKQRLNRAIASVTLAVVFIAGVAYGRQTTVSICFAVPTTQAQRVLDGVAGANNYQATVPDPAHPGQTMTNPETESQFVKRMVIQYVRESVRSYEATKAAEAARSTAAGGADTISIQ